MDVELWDDAATHMIGAASFSVVALLACETRVLEEVLLIGLPGCEPVGSVQVNVEVSELAVGVAQDPW